MNCWALPLPRFLAPEGSPTAVLKPAGTLAEVPVLDVEPELEPELELPAAALG